MPSYPPPPNANGPPATSTPPPLCTYSLRASRPARCSGAAGTFYELPGSGVNGAFLDSNPTGLIYSSMASNVPGRQQFFARAGGVIVADQSAVEGVSQSFDLGYMTPGQITVNWGDGTALEVFAVSAEGPVSRPHTYADDGVRTVTVSGPFPTRFFSVLITNATPTAEITEIAGGTGGGGSVDPLKILFWAWFITAGVRVT